MPKKAKADAPPAGSKPTTPEKGKKGGKKKKKPPGKTSTDDYTFDPPEAGPMSSYVKLSLRLVTWHFLNADLDAMPLSTSLLQLKHAIVAKHGGSLSDLVLYPHQVTPKPPVQSDTVTLADLGYKGGPITEPVVAKMYYDFVPHETDCPLVMCELPLVHGAQSGQHRFSGKPVVSAGAASAVDAHVQPHQLQVSRSGIDRQA